MSLIVMSAIMLGGLIILLAIGVEIFAAIGLMGVIGLGFFVGQPLQQFAYTGFYVMNSFVLTCLPLFVFMGTIFYATGVTRHLFAAANKLIGNLPGGVACSVIAASGVFGAISGSSLAAAATFGKIAYPDMERLGYEPKLALGSIAIGGTLSVLIPPSIILIVYGSWQSLSVARLFACALIPGIMLTVLLILTVIIMVLINPARAPRPPRIPISEKLRALLDISPFLAVIFAVLGVIFGGIMTPTEAASVGALMSIILALAYRCMSFAALKESMWTAVKLNSMIAFVIFTANVLATVFNYIGLTDVISIFIGSLPFGTYGVFVIICIMYIILGMFFDSLSMMVLTLPFIGPVISNLGFNPFWFGVTYVILAEIGLVTPPFGLNLFILRGVVPKYDILTVALGALPFLIPTLLCIVILTIFPQIALWLPSIIFG